MSSLPRVLFACAICLSCVCSLVCLWTLDTSSCGFSLSFLCLQNFVNLTWWFLLIETRGLPLDKKVDGQDNQRKSEYFYKKWCFHHRSESLAMNRWWLTLDNSLVLCTPVLLFYCNVCSIMLFLGDSWCSISKFICVVVAVVLDGWQDPPLIFP
jgi:hypothetical protein